MEIVLLIIGLLVGVIIGYLFARLSINVTNEIPESILNTLSEKSKELEIVKTQLIELRDDKLKVSVTNGELSKEKELLSQRLESTLQEVRTLRQQIGEERKLSAAMNQKQEILQNQLVTQKKELLEVQSKFTKEFENIANKVLDEKTQKFTDHNKEKLGEILAPFQQKIKDFKEEVEKSQYKSTQERIELKEHIKQLTLLNETMQKETQNLTLALKQDSKAQGNWGEVILERVLESSGLVKNREYFTQQTFSDSDSDKSLRPDVVVKMPDNKCIIVDSKVSLTAYNQLINAENDFDRDLALKAHLLSIKNHINGLAGKNYQFAEGLNSPDFVLLFVPIESSFSIATQADNSLFNYAWERKIVIVSPSTLLATLRTIASVWKHEYQNKNAAAIADRASKMYDKFVGFISDMQNIGTHLERSEKTYKEAMKKLTDGSGNLVGMAQKIVDLGAKPKKSLPKNLRED